MKIVFRTDASSTIGTGHVVRCLTLANALHGQGVEVSFICREHDGHLCELIAKNSYTVNRLPARCTGFKVDNTSAYASWLGAECKVDASQTKAVIEAMGEKPDWLIVDHYAIDCQWEGVLRATVQRIMVIDDLADRQHDCDLLLDQNLVAEMHTRYVGRTPAICGILLGPRYALLQSIYKEMHNHVLSRRGPIRRILIFFSGISNNNLTEQAIAAFLSLNRTDIDVDVVAPYSQLEIIREQVVTCQNVHLHCALPSLAPLIAKADIAIGASGSANWERLCLGLPTLVVSLAENQRSIAEELDRQGLIRYLGHVDTVDSIIIAHGLEDLIQKGLDENWSVRCAAEVDGMGANRVCAILTTTSKTHLIARNAGLEDESLLLEWANDQTTRQNAFSFEQIAMATHQSWFRSRLSNLEGFRFYIVETEGGFPIGQVRFERQGPTWEIHYSLALVFRKRGLGRCLLDVAMQKLRDENVIALIFGRVKSDNLPSRKVFESLGFEVMPDVSNGVVQYWREL